MNLRHLCLIVFIIFSGTLSLCAQDNFIIKHIKPNYNNKQISINEISQDSIGNIWMSSADGILKYNGYSYNLIKNNQIFPSGLPNDYVDALFKGNNNVIWIKSYHGLLTKYNATNGIFTPIKNITEQAINSVKPFKDGVVIGTENGEVFTFLKGNVEKVLTIPNINKKRSRIVHIEIINDTEFYISTSLGKVFNYSLKTNEINELVGPFTDYPEVIRLEVDAKNKLWIGTEAHGLFVYDIFKKEFIQDNFFKGNINKINKELFITFFYDSNGYIWAGTDGGGLYIINSVTGEVTVHKYKYPNEFSLSSNTIMNISEDQNNNIWLVTNRGQVNVIPKPTNNIDYHNGSINGIPLRVLSVYKSNNETLYIGTDGNGLVKIEKNKKEQDFFNDVDNNFYIQSITEDNTSNIWLGTYRNGLWKYNKNQNLFEKIPVINNLNQKATDVRTVFKDSKGRIWVGSNVALNIYNSKSEVIASFNNTSNGLNGANFESIIEDKNNTIWIGQINSGLFKFNEDVNLIEKSTFINYPYKEKSAEIRVIDMCLGKKNEIWLINENNNLILFNSKSKKFTNTKKYFPNKERNFTAVVAHDENNLWLSSYNGIHHLNLVTKKVESYYTSDGLQEGFHVSRSKFIDNTGKVYFGSQKGLHFFNPKKLTKTPSEGNLFISNIDILNKPAKDIIPSQITSDIFTINTFKLKNNQSSFSIRFSAINNILNSNYYYSYKLEGFDDDWKSTYYEGLASYTNIPAGNYKLKIKANEINKPLKSLNKTINISIAPPFWKTPIAYVVYILLLFSLILSASKWYIVRNKLLINKISRRKEKELNNAKMDFFTKMSHEIQTPITLILSPIEDMLKKAEANGNLLLKERLNVISNNAERLSRIARELTLIKNQKLNELKLQVTQNNLCNNIESISLSFKELARVKKIDFNVSCPKNLTTTWYDKEKLEHILYNIIDNAFKFTPPEGNIQLNVQPISKKKCVKISVSDSGLGIKKDELEDIFKLFYRSSNTIKGTGIGLALTKELVDVHKGKIKVKSSKSEGTTFIVKIPIAEENYLDSEKITSSEKTENIKPIEITPSKKTHPYDLSKNTILVVEDNFELQNFLKELLVEEYNVLLAENGKEGFYYAKNNIPDLIISDIMMPEMDGIELCEKLLKNKLTKHIPIILLTAKNSTQTKISGLKAGAIEYINKPFNSNELLLKIKNNLIKNEHIISKYKNELINKPHIKIKKSQDEIFLENLNTIVNNCLSNSQFKVDELADKLNMSHSSLYRKCSALTGLSLVDYIRQLRLKKAAILLVKYGYNISEVAYMVGFNNPKYFSKSFKNQFSITPKQFKNKAKSATNINIYLQENNVDVMDIE